MIDEFQEFSNINESVYSDMQNIWDQYRLKSHMNLIVSGSVWSLMHKIFQNAKEPLFGRADNILRLSAFSIATLKQIISDYRPKYSNDDLLALYAFTGGINTQPEIESALGDKSIGGQMKRLIEDYNVITRVRPILSKEGTQTVRYEIRDNFIRFWFNYFDRHRSLTEIKNFDGLKAIIRADYPTWSGKILEIYFKQLFAESMQYRDIGSWWEPKGHQNEIDIVALKLEKNRAVVAEVKRQKKNVKPEHLEAKVAHLRNKLLPDYKIETRILSLNEM